MRVGFFIDKSKQKMATKSKHEIDELLVFGFIRCEIDINDDEIPLDIMNLSVFSI